MAKPSAWAVAGLMLTVLIGWVAHVRDDLFPPGAEGLTFGAMLAGVVGGALAGPTLVLVFWWLCPTLAVLLLARWAFVGRRRSHTMHN